jgi:alpha-mannosidase
MKTIFRVGLALLVFASIAIYPQSNDLSKDKVLYTVGYAHLDTEWRWDYQTTINEYIWNTMAMNFRLMEKYPDYVFNFSGANRYKMMKEYYPQEYEKVKKLVAAGRWFPAGSSMEENDALAPSHESIIRQILLGGNYFRKEFGVSSTDYMLPDCFGFPASLPSILAHCGIKGFSTQKLAWGSNVGIPFNVGLWIGPDGESIVAALNPGDYSGRVQEDLSLNAGWKKRIYDLGAKTGVFADYMYYGTGDVGGSPTEDSVKWIEKSLANVKDFKVVSAKSDQLFNDLTAAQKAKLPTYKGELLLTNHSAGSITSAAFQKRLNRKNELLAYRAEVSSAMGEWLGGMAYDREKMNEAWRLVMGGQFHDILPGTSIPRAYEFAWNDEFVAANQFANIFADASGAVARAMDTQAQGVPLAVFNPLAFEREDIVEAAVTFPGAAPKAVKVYGRDNKEVPSQVLKVEGNKITILFLAKTPSLGYAAFDVRPSDAPCSLATGLKITPSSLENSKYAMKLNADGDVVSIFDKAAKKELLSAPIKLEFHYEKPQQWPAWNQDWEDRVKPASGCVEGPAKIRIAENGPARVALEVDRESRHSRFVQTIRLAADGSSDRVEFDTHIDWATLESSLKAAFPLSVSNPLATYSFGVGTVQRGNNEPVRFEVPSHQWFDLTHKDGSYGVSVLEDCKYGSDKPADNIVRLTLLYTPGVRTSYREQRVQDFGKHEILYALYGHKGDWRAADSNLQAARINQPLTVFQTAPHPGPLGKAFSFLTVNDRGVVVSAVKKAENGDDLIVRVVEAKGKTVKNVELSFAGPVVSAREVNGQEQDLAAAAVRNGKLVFDITPYHLRTFALKLKPAGKALALPQNTPLELPYNIDVMSFDAHKADGDFDGRGRSLPAEMLPDVITSENIRFKLGPKADGAANAVSCQGQTVKLPAGDFNKLYILAAASDLTGGGGPRGGEDAAARNAFKIGGASFEIPVEIWSGYFGQWDRRLWEGVKPADLNFDLNTVEYAGLAPGYVRKSDIAFFTTHRHLRSGDNEPYAYAYLYKYKIDLPQGAKELTLPANERIKVLAVTAARNDNDATVPAQPLFDTLPRDPAEYVRFAACSGPLISPEKANIDYDKPLTVVMIAKDETSEIRYTLDGSLPTPASPKYTAPLSLNQTAVVKAAAFDKVKLPSVVTIAYFSRSLPVKSIQYVVPLPARRGVGAGGERPLIDLRRATVESTDRAWQAFDRIDLDVILDLGQEKTLGEITLGCLENNDARIFLPASVEISLSADNKDYKVAAAAAYSVPETAQPVSLKNLNFSLKNAQGRFIHIIAKNVGTLPKWHKNAGQPNANAMMYVDEIIVK